MPGAGRGAAWVRRAAAVAYHSLTGETDRAGPKDRKGKVEAEVEKQGASFLDRVRENGWLTGRGAGLTRVHL